MLHYVDFTILLQLADCNFYNLLLILNYKGLRSLSEAEL